MPSSLIQLDLSENNISKLTENGTNAFQNLTNLKYLLLNLNQIKTLSSTDMNSLVNLEYIELEGNLLVSWYIYVKEEGNSILGIKIISAISDMRLLTDVFYVVV